MAIGWGTLLAALPTALKYGTKAYKAYANRNRDPNEFITAEDVIRSRMTPEQRNLKLNELRQAERLLSRPQRVYRAAGGFGYVPMAQGAQDVSLGAQQKVKPLGGLSRRLLNIERSNLESGYQSDLGDIGALLTRLNPLGLRSSGAAAMRGRAFGNRFNTTLAQQMKMLSDFALENALSDVEGSRLNRMQQEVEEELAGRTGRIGRAETGLDQDRAISDYGYQSDRAAQLNRIENRRRNIANQRLQAGLSPSYRTSAAPPMFKG